MNQKINFFYVGILLLVSCNYGNQEISVDKDLSKDKMEEVDSLNKKNVNEISAKYNSYVEWNDSDKFNRYHTNMFSYEFQDKICKDSNLSFIGNIRDIIKDNSLYILRVSRSSGFGSDCLANIIVDSIMFQKLKSEVRLHKPNQKICFIIKIEKVNSILPKLSAEKDEGDDDSYVTYNFEKLIVFKGKLIDYYVYKKYDYEIN